MRGQGRIRGDLASKYESCILGTESRTFSDQMWQIDHVTVIDVVCLSSQDESNSMRIRLAAGV
jgi:hypothetical protein